MLDGELVVLDDQGKPQFERLARRARMKQGLAALPLLKRKKSLEEALRSAQRIRPTG